MGSVDVGRQAYPPGCLGCRAEDDKENLQQAWHGLQKQVYTSARLSEPRNTGQSGWQCQLVVVLRPDDLKLRETP